MNKLIMTFLSLLGLMTISVPTDAAIVDQVLATVNSEAITFSDYKRFISRSGSSASPERVDESLLKKLIDDKIILIEANKSGIDATESELFQIIKEFQDGMNLSDEEFERKLAEEGITVTDYKIHVKENIISLKFIDRELNTRIIVTDEEIDDYYKKNIELFIDKRERKLVKAIFLKFNPHPTLTEITDLKLKSLKIVADIKRGEPFEKMNDLYSTEPLKSRDGLLGEFERGELITELDLAISSLREGEVSDPVWTKEGVYILKMIREIEASHVPLIQARDQIYSTLYQKRRENTFTEWLKSLWEKSSVTIK